MYYTNLVNSHSMLLAYFKPTALKIVLESTDSPLIHDAVCLFVMDIEVREKVPSAEEFESCASYLVYASKYTVLRN